MLKQAFSEAVKRKYIGHNPLADVKPPKEDKDEVQILSPDQVKYLLESVRGHRFELAVVLGATCALRIGEVLSLRWTDFNMTKGTVTIERTLWRGSTWPTKTVGSRRTLKLPNIALLTAAQRSKDDDPRRPGRPWAAEGVASHVEWDRRAGFGSTPPMSLGCREGGSVGKGDS